MSLRKEAKFKVLPYNLKNIDNIEQLMNKMIKNKVSASSVLL